MVGRGNPSLLRGYHRYPWSSSTRRQCPSMSEGDHRSQLPVVVIVADSGGSLRGKGWSATEAWVISSEPPT